MFLFTRLLTNRKYLLFVLDILVYAKVKNGLSSSSSYSEYCIACPQNTLISLSLPQSTMLGQSSISSPAWINYFLCPNFPIPPFPLQASPISYPSSWWIFSISGLSICYVKKDGWLSLPVPHPKEHLGHSWNPVLFSFTCVNISSLATSQVEQAILYWIFTFQIIFHVQQPTWLFTLFSSLYASFTL